MSAGAFPARAAKPIAARVGAGAVLLMLLAVLVPLMALSSAQQPADARVAPGEIPAVYVPIYRAAQQAFGVHWLLLAAIHKQESDFSRLRVRGHGGDAVTSGWNGCGAAGPMQFGIVGIHPYRGTAPACGGLTGTGAGGTWARYRDALRRLPAGARPNSYPLMRERLDGCRTVPRSHGCVYDDVDAIAAAAAYLHDLGARAALDDRAWHAARRYNGAAAYADAVLAQARQWHAQATDDMALLDPATQQIPGSKAKLGQDGLARAPADAPPEVKRAIAAANSISDRPYLLRHYPTHINNPTYDCSSSSSHVLWGAGAFGRAPWVSGQFTRYGRSGPGRWITIYAHGGHMFLIIAGLRFDTARYDTGPNRHETGPRWRLGPRPTAGFTVRRPPGL